MISLGIVVAFYAQPAHAMDPIRALKKFCAGVAAEFGYPTASRRYAQEDSVARLRKDYAKYHRPILDDEVLEMRKALFSGRFRELSREGSPNATFRVPQDTYGSQMVMTWYGGDRWLKRLIQWSEKGLGAEVRGFGVHLETAGRSPIGTQFIVVQLEDIAAEKNKLGKKLAANDFRSSDNIALLKELPEEDRKWTLATVQAVLDEHPDPHVGNVMFRITELAGAEPRTLRSNQRRLSGNRLLEILLVDPGEPHPLALNARDAPLADVGKYEARSWQYNRLYQKNFLSRALALGE